MFVEFQHIVLKTEFLWRDIFNIEHLQGVAKKMKLWKLTQLYRRSQPNIGLAEAELENYRFLTVKEKLIDRILNPTAEE